MTDSGAFQGDAFQGDAFQTGLATIRETASHMTLNEAQVFGNVLARHKRGEATDHELIEAVPEPAKSLLRASGDRRLAWAGILLSASSLVTSVVSNTQLDQTLQDQRREIHTTLQIVEAEQKSVDRLLESIDSMMDELREAMKEDRPHAGAGHEESAKNAP